MSRINTYKKLQKKLRIILMLLLALGVSGQSTAFAADLIDENYDDNSSGIGGYSSSDDFVLDGVRYQLTNKANSNDITNDNVQTSLGDGVTDYYLWLTLGSGGSVTISLDSGLPFKLVSFEIDAWPTDKVTLTSSSGGLIEYTPAVPNGWVATTVSPTTNFDNITSFTISGELTYLFIDDLNLDTVSPPTYTVTYDGNTATSGSAPSATNYTSGQVVTVDSSGTLAKNGHTFNGWNTASDGSGTSYASGATFSMVASNITLYAQWTPDQYSVTYNSNGATSGSVPTDGSTYAYSTNATVLGNTGSLAKTGYTFSGWNTLSDGSGTSFNPTDSLSVLSNTTLYANWTPIDYTVTYNANGSDGGSVPTDAINYHIGDTVTVKTNSGTLVKTGYDFANWNTASDGSGTAYAPNDTFAVASSSITLYAQWTLKTYGVTYNSNGSSGGSVPTDGLSYNLGSTVTVKSSGTIVRTGYTFDGWNTASNGSGTNYTSGDTFSMGSSDVTLYAKWLQDQYTLTYDANDSTSGTVPTDANTYSYGASATTLTNSGSLTKTGYTFGGWNTLANGSGTHYNTGVSATINANTTLYAEWTPIDYTITYNGNANTGGSVPNDASLYHIGDSVTLLANSGSLTKTGYIFGGWNTASDGTGTTYASGTTLSIGSANITLYAKWILQAYHLTYDSTSADSGSVPTDANNYQVGDTVTVMSKGSLVKLGYTFDGWNTQSNGSGTLYSPSDTFNIGASDITLFAMWSQDQYGIIYNANSANAGTVPTDAGVYHYGDNATILSNSGSLVKSGFTFKGWNTQANGSGTHYNENATVSMSQNLSLFAEWESNTPSGSNNSGTTGNNTNETNPLPANITVSDSNKFTKDTNGDVWVNIYVDQQTKADKAKVLITSQGDKTKVDLLLDENAVINDFQNANNTVMIPVKGKVDDMSIVFSANMINNLANDNILIQAQLNDVTYNLPSKEVDFASIRNLLGQDVSNDQLKIKVEIDTEDFSEQEAYETKVNQTDVKTLVQPISFKVYASYTDNDGNERDVELNQFSHYVDRVVMIPDNIDPSQITTGIVFDGDIHHVPTVVYEENSMWYAKMNSLTNSHYSVVENHVEIASVSDHWSKEIVNDLASRMVIDTTQNFNPDDKITRGEFITYLVYGLGLYQNLDSDMNNFSDNTASTGIDENIFIAKTYGLVSGYQDNTFRSEQLVTKQEAMVVINNALKLIDTQLIQANRPDEYMSLFKVDDWAKEGVALVVSSDLLKGLEIDSFDPHDNLTYAEAAQIVHNLLVQTGLIND